MSNTTKIERHRPAHAALHRRFENYLIGLAALYKEISERPAVAEQFVQQTGEFINRMSDLSGERKPRRK